MFTLKSISFGITCISYQFVLIYVALLYNNSFTLNSLDLAYSATWLLLQFNQPLNIAIISHLLQLQHIVSLQTSIAAFNLLTVLTTKQSFPCVSHTAT